MYPVEPEVVILADKTFQIFARDLHVEEFTISLMRYVWDGINTPIGTKILFRYPLPIIGLRTTNNHLLGVCVVVCSFVVAVVVVSLR